MTKSETDAWQQAVRELNTTAMSALLADDPRLAHEQIVHTRANGTTYGVLPLEMSNTSLEATRILIEAGADPNRNGDGNSLAIHNAPLDVMTFLLDAGADVNKIGYEECTPLMYEVYGKQLDRARLLIERGANVNYQRELEGNSPLHFSAQKNDLSMIELLLAAGADKKLKNNEGKIPADLARDNGHNENADKLQPSAR